jgi:outer membrane protein TolC
MKSTNLLLSALCILAPALLQAQQGANYSESAIANRAVDNLQALTSNSIIATNQPAANDSSIQGISVSAQATAEALTNAPVLATNLPASPDQSLTGASVLPTLSSNPPAQPQGLNAGTNSFTNLPVIAPTDLPAAPMITNPITPGSLPAPLPTTATGPITMPTAGINDFGLSDKVTNIPLTAEALAKAGNKVIPGVIAKNARKLTIDEAVQLALQKNPDVLIAIENIRKASGNYITVRAGLLPQFGIQQSAYSWVEPSFQKGQVPPTAKNSPYASSFTPNSASWNVAFQGNQLLFDGWKTPANTAAAKFSEQIAYYELRQTIDSTIAKIVQQFYQVVLDRALVIANEQQVALYQTQVSDQQSRYDAGTVPRFNVLQAQVQLANAEPPLIQAKNNLRVALFTLVKTIGLDYPNIQNIEIPFDVVGALDYYPRKIDSDASIHTALQRNPQLKAQRQNILVAAKQITAAIAGWMPTINANGGYQIQSYNYDNSLMTAVQGWFFGASGSWAIFDGLSTYGNVKQAKATMMNYKTVYDNGVREVILQVQQAISNLKQASETIISQKATVEQAVEALRLSRERLDAGAGVQLDVINAQVQLLQAQTSVLQALYSYISATAEYDRALSLNTKYEEFFDDPMNKWEQRRFKDLNANDRPRPDLPRSLKKSDPLPPSTQFNDVIKSSTVRKGGKSASGNKNP